MSPLDSTSADLLENAGGHRPAISREEPLFTILLGLTILFLLIGLIFVQMELYSFYKIILLFKA